MKPKYFLMAFVVLFILTFSQRFFPTIPTLPFFAFSWISLFIYFVIRIKNNSHLGFKRLSISLGIFSSITISLITIILSRHDNDIWEYIIIITFSANAGLFLSEMIQWILIGFKKSSANN